MIITLIKTMLEYYSNIVFIKLNIDIAKLNNFNTSNMTNISTYEYLEKFEPIPDMENYTISRSGNIKNIHDVQLSCDYSSTYPRVKLTINGKRKGYSIHRLVAQTFIPNPFNKPEVDHIDRDKLNFKRSNLRWVTKSENAENKRDIRIPVIQLHLNLNPIKTFNSAKEACEELKIAGISRALKNQHKTAGGFKWRYDSTRDSYKNYINKLDVEHRQIQYKRYEITNTGLLWSNKTNRYLTQQVREDGYMDVGLTVNGNSKKHLVHRLVAQTFIDNSMELPVVNHKDGDKKNNDVSNLEWVTFSDNSMHAHDTGLSRTRREVCKFKLDGTYVESYNSITEATSSISERKNISAVCMNKKRSCNGFLWMYMEECLQLDDGTYVILPDRIRERCSMSYISVCQFDLDGTFIEIYDSITNASLFTGSNRSSISSVCNGRESSCNGFLWMHADECEQENGSYVINFDHIRKKMYACKSVCQFDLDGTFIEIYESILVAAVSTQSSKVTISKVCKKQNRYCNGFLWMYADDCDQIDDVYVVDNNRIIEEKDRKKMKMRGKSVCQFDLDGTFIEIYDSITEAEVCNKLKHIARACGIEKRRRKCGGYIWRYSADCDKQEDGTYSISSGNIMRKTNKCKSICQFSLDKVFIQCFESGIDASQKTKITRSSISNAIAGKLKTAGGFLWMNSVDCIQSDGTYLISQDRIKRKNTRGKSVCQYDLNMIFICKFDSITKASKKIGVSASCISGMLTGKYNTAGGFIWKYFEEGDVII
jgi:hypothetical protein